MALRKLVIRIAIPLLFCSSVLADTDDIDASRWLLPIIKENEVKKTHDVTIEKYFYKGESVYVVSHTGQCCDLGQHCILSQVHAFVAISA